MTQNNERVDITPLQQVNAVQSIREAKTLDDALRVMNGLAANGWLKLWDSATHPDGTSWRDKSPISQNEQQAIPEDVIKDAERYNWLKQNYHGFEMFRHSTIPYVTLDREVDKAMLNPTHTLCA